MADTTCAWLCDCALGAGVGVILVRLAVACRLLSTTTFYRNSCSSELSSQGWNATSIASLCNWMGYCGWPVGAETRDTSYCSVFQGVPLSSDAKTALCGNATISCPK